VRWCGADAVAARRQLADFRFLAEPSCRRVLAAETARSVRRCRIADLVDRASGRLDEADAVLGVGDGLGCAADLVSSGLDLTSPAASSAAPVDPETRESFVMDFEWRTTRVQVAYALYGPQCSG